MIARTSDADLTRGWNDFSASIGDDDLELFAAMTLLGRFHEDGSYEVSTDIHDEIEMRLMSGDSVEQVREFLIQKASGKSMELV